MSVNFNNIDDDAKLMFEIEEIECKYLEKFYYFLKYAQDEILEGLQTKEKIKNDWDQYWQNESHSDFDVGAERIIYALFNGKGIGQPNSSPVGADLFFEVKDAFIHIDLKTVEASGNIGDFNTSIFIGENQNSYAGNMIVNKTEYREYKPSLPYFYNDNTENKKICLTYFITILYDKKNIDVLMINLICMPNGKLYNHYKHRPLRAGKNKGKTRFNFKEVSTFELLNPTKSRIKLAYVNNNKIDKYKDKLQFLLKLNT